MTAAPPRSRRRRDERARTGTRNIVGRHERGRRQSGTSMHLHEFITSHRASLIALTKANVTLRPWPSPSDSQLESGIPLFLTQLAETLRLQNTGSPYSASAIGSSATKHGGHLN